MSSPVWYIGEVAENRLALQVLVLYCIAIKYLAVATQIVFSEAWYIGTAEENPSEARLPMPAELFSAKVHAKYAFSARADPAAEAAAAAAADEDDAEDDEPEPL